MENPFEPSQPLEQEKEKQQPQQQKLPQQSPQEKALMSQLGEVSTRLRLLEERYANLRKKAQLTEQNLIRFDRDFNDEIKALNERINDFKKEVQQLRDKVEILMNQAQEYAREDDLKLLAKYLDFIQPNRFITREEAQELIEAILRQKE